MSVIKLLRLTALRITLLCGLTSLIGCVGYPAPGGIGYMGSGGFSGMGPMMGGYGMGPMGMGMSGYSMGAGAMGAGTMGTAYGTGGMELGTNLGGWGEGTGDDWGHTQVKQGAGTVDNDPHLTSSYHNTDFDNGRGDSFYHPGVNPSAGSSASVN